MGHVILADAIRAARADKKVSLLTAATEIGISTSYLETLEKGTKTNPTFSVLSRVLEYFHIDFGKLQPPQDREEG